MSQLSLQLIEKEKQEKTGKLDLGNCGLKEIPEELFQLTWLEELSFCNRILDNKKKSWVNSSNSGGKNHIFITELPAGFRNLTRLKKLYFGGEFGENWRLNKCDILSCLENLQTLDLSTNQISDISFLERLTGLQTLDLSDNQISDIKPLLTLIKSGVPISKDSFGTGILIGNNPISTPPISIVEEGREAVLNWFEQMEEGEKPLFETKLMILGQAGAGKTTFANLELNHDYIVEPGKIDSTLGIIVHKNKEFQHQKLNHQKIKAHLWDFGGQDIQKMLHQFFITENCLYLLVSDKRAENTNFDYWFQIINLLGPKSSVIILENPKDIDSANKDFPLTTYRELFKELAIEKIEVNLAKTRDKAKTRWQLLNETIEEKLSGLEIVNRQVPKKWASVRNELEKLEKKKYISKDTFYQICSKPEIGMTNEQADLCLFYLGQLGDLAYFDDRDLCTHIFLDQNWLTEGMYYILSDKQIQDNKGRFTRKQAYHQWDSKGYNEEEKAMLLRLLLKDNFDICYELKHEKDVFITPLLLPSDKPEKREWETNLLFRYQYVFIPHGMFSRLIVRIHEKIDAEQRWETGVRLIDSFNGNTVLAEVQQYTDPDENQQVIDIKINGGKEGCKHLLSFVRTAIDDLHKDFRNIRFNRLVACNCDTCISRMKAGKKPSLYNYEKLQSKIKNKKYFEECSKSNYKSVNIGKILSDVVIENAAIENADNELLYRLKEMGMGMSINQIQNINKPETNIAMSDFGKAVTDVSAGASADATAKAEATSRVSMEIQNILDETGLLKEDIERELKIKKVPEEEIKLFKSDVEVFENALKEIETANNNTQKLPEKSKNRLKRFWEDLSNEKSSLYKSLKLLRKGKDYGVKIAETYNKFAENTGMPVVPPLVLKAIKG